MKSWQPEPSERGFPRPSPISTVDAKVASVMLTVPAVGTVNDREAVPCTARVLAKVRVIGEGAVVLPQAAHSNSNPNTPTRVAVMGPSVSANGRSAGSIAALDPTAFGPDSQVGQA